MYHVSFSSILAISNIKFYYRYTCTLLATIHDRNWYYWNTSVSESCCLHCDGTVYKADTVIETIEKEDECATVESLGTKLNIDKI